MRFYRPECSEGCSRATVLESCSKGLLMGRDWKGVLITRRNDTTDLMREGCQSACEVTKPLSR